MKKVFALLVVGTFAFAACNNEKKAENTTDTTSQEMAPVDTTTPMAPAPTDSTAMMKPDTATTTAPASSTGTTPAAKK